MKLVRSTTCRIYARVCSAVAQLLRPKHYCSVVAASAAAVVFANYLVLDLVLHMCAVALHDRAVISDAAAPQYHIAASASAATATVVGASATASAPVLQCCRLPRPSHLGLHAPPASRPWSPLLLVRGKRNLNLGGTGTADGGSLRVALPSMKLRPRQY